MTRDRRFASGSIGDMNLSLVDTAGFEDVDDDTLEARMRRQTELAIDEADVCLFLIDGRVGVTPSDEVFADILRKKSARVILGVNKAELGMTLIGGLWGTLVELATGSVAVSFVVLLLSPALSSPLVSVLTGTGFSRQQIVIATLALLMGYAAPYVILVVANGA